MLSTLNEYCNNNLENALELCLNKNLLFLGYLLSKTDIIPSTKYNVLKGQIVNSIISPGQITTKSKPDDMGARSSAPIPNQLDSKSESSVRKKIKLLCNFLTCEDLTKLWSKMKTGREKFELITGGEPDFYVVINRPPINEYPDLSKTILIRMEPNMEQFPQLWGDWASPNEHLFHRIIKPTLESHNNVEWHLSKSYNELKSLQIEKKHEFVVSTVLSEKYRDPGHIRRVDFVKFLEQKGVPVHVYGSNKWRYEDYKGSLPYHEKDKALFPYKYTFNAENHSLPGYFTEKLVDGILAECLVFYWGCPDIVKYLPKDSFIQLDLVDFEKDSDIIRTAIREDWWSKRIDSIRKAKSIILDELQFFSRLNKML